MNRLSRLLGEAIRYFGAYGYVSPAEVEEWTGRVEAAATDPVQLKKEEFRVRERLEGAFERAFRRGALLRRHRKIEVWAAQRLAPELRAELERRIYASIDLIRLNRKAAVARTIQRFKGWVTSVPAGGAPVENIAVVKRDMSKAALHARWIERRVAVDQTAKMLGNLNDVVANGAGAIAGTWDATWEIRRKHRPEHVVRHDLTYVVRGSWADEQGLIKRPHGYVDEHDLPAQLINCRCEYVYLYDLEDIPPDMLTAKGRAALAKGREAA